MRGREVAESASAFPSLNCSGKSRLAVSAAFAVLFLRDARAGACRTAWDRAWVIAACRCPAAGAGGCCLRGVLLGLPQLGNRSGQRQQAGDERRR